MYWFRNRLVWIRKLIFKISIISPEKSMFSVTILNKKYYIFVRDDETVRDDKLQADIPDRMINYCS
jgi:hypothetical protein